MRTSPKTSRTRTASPAGSGGSSTASSAATASASSVIAANAQRQPTTPPISVPAGTPSTDATAIPLKITAVARPADSCRTSRTASPAATAQTPPMHTPTRARATSSTPKAGASAESRLAAASRTSSAHSTVLRSARRTATGSRGAESAATTPGRVSVNPVVPSEVRSPSPREVSSPTGSISVVTTQKVAAASARTDGGNARPSRGCWVVCSMGTRLRRAAPGDNAESLILV